MFTLYLPLHSHLVDGCCGWSSTYGSLPGLTTISTETLNGLIFYVNIVSTSGLTNFHFNGSIHPILSTFIADLGEETCFYPGLDIYQKTWLQFAFPLYIWLLVVAIIVVSYCSKAAIKLFGRNNIALLATLFLLSYSKLQKTTVTSFILHTIVSLVECSHCSVELAVLYKRFLLLIKGTVTLCMSLSTATLFSPKKNQ